MAGNRNLPLVAPDDPHGSALQEWQGEKVWTPNGTTGRAVIEAAISLRDGYAITLSEAYGIAATAIRAHLLYGKNGSENTST